MNAFWSYFWPPFAAGLAIGLIAGLLALRRRDRDRIIRLSIGVAAAIGAALLWHGPLGGATAFSRSIGVAIRATTVFYEIPEVSGHLHHAPLTRHVTLTGPANDFQQSELVRLMNDLPGVADTGWKDSGGGLPLIVEGSISGLLGFLLGLGVAYLVELRRRRRANRKW
jgi:hypothetical protein